MPKMEIIAEFEFDDSVQRTFPEIIERVVKTNMTRAIKDALEHNRSGLKTGVKLGSVDVRIS